jgi:hypothetical protein
VKQPGCCGGCGGDGVDPTAYESNGQCWDCYGTGHAHEGRCRSRFLDWWHLKEGAVVFTAMVWTILTTAFGAPLAYGLMPWLVALGACVSVGPALLALTAVIVLGRLADRQIGRYGPPPTLH